MAEYPPICRICLSYNVRLFMIADTSQLVFEKITGTPLLTADQRPVTACYICFAQLKRCHKLMLTSARAEELLTNLLERNFKLTKKSLSLIDRKAKGLSNSLVISPPQCVDTHLRAKPIAADPSNVEIKTEHLEEIEVEFEDLPKTPKPLETPVVEDNTVLHDRITFEGLINDQYEFTVNLETQEQDHEVSKIISDDASAISRETEKAVQEILVLNDQEPQCSFMQSSEKPHDSGQLDEKPYECSICKHRFACSTYLKTHIRIHTGEKPFKCLYCDSRFSHSSALKNHMRTHTGLEPYKCNICERRFKTNTSLKCHLRTHTGEKPFECNICQRNFSRVDHLRLHTATHNCEKLHECNVCQMRFSRSFHLKRHLKIHTGEKDFECSFCKRRFVSKSNWEKHLRKHTGEHPYECDVCQRRYKHKESLRNHLTINTGDKVCKCKYCKKKFHHKLKNRLRICHTCLNRSNQT